MTAERVFRTIVGLLESAGIPNMLTGSFASAFHGVPRATQDIDLVIAATAPRLRAFVQKVPAEYYVDEAAALEAFRNESQFNLIDLEAGWKVDLMVRRDRPFSRIEFDRRQRAQVWGTTLDVVTIEDLIVAKLEWAKLGESDRQLEDVTGLLRLRAPDLDRSYLSHWIADLGLGTQWNRAADRAGVAR